MKKDRVDTKAIEPLCTALLESISEDPEREGLLKTPQRYAKAIKDLTIGYSQDAETIVNGALFSDACSEMVLVRDIEFYSLCEHHLLPFFGKVHVAYIPDGTIVGLSKIPRIVNMFARRLQVQERFTEQITECLNTMLKPGGVACVVEGRHMCMMMRGIQNQNGTMLTSSMRGEFLKPATRNEFMQLIKSQ